MMQVAAEYALPKVVCSMRFQIFVWTLLTTETQRHRENESCVSLRAPCVRGMMAA